MKALIVTEGGKGIGFGHLARCIGLKKALESYNIQTEMVVKGDASVKKQFSNEISQSFDWLSNQTRANQLLKKADIAVIDSYLAPINFFQKISKKVLVRVYIDDFLRLSYPSGIVVNGTIDAEKFKYPKNKNVRYLLGSKFAILRQGFWKNPKRKVRESIQNILITFGGMDRSLYIENLLVYLQKRYPKFNFHVITGQTPSARFKKVKFYQNIQAEEMKKLMYACDIAISAGGQTLNELAACGLPMIGICFADNQKLNLKGWQKTGFLKYAGHSNDPSLFQNIEALIKQFTFKRRTKMAQTGQKLVDGQGALRIAGELINSSFSFPNVQPKDRKQIYKWSNAPEVRAISFNTKPIEWANHCQWFTKKINDSKCRFFKINWLRHSIGQIRFELNGKKANISISLDRKFRGKGLGAHAIRISTKKVFHEVPRISTIDAFVKEKNKGSAYAFLNAGFRYEGKKLVNQQKVLTFKKRRHEIISN